MRCPDCGHPNPDGNRFCGGCGRALAQICTGCGEVNPPAQKFCGACGQSLSALPQARATPGFAPRRVDDYTPKHLARKILQTKSALEGERKQVTVLFADIQSSMELAGRLDPERWHALLERYFAILGDAVHRYEGTINQYTGDGIMALFGAPIAHEDHAQRACYAALTARAGLRAFADELRIEDGLNLSFRLGLNSGDVVVGKIGDDLRMDYTAQGATVGVAQRVEQLAAPGNVCVSGATAALVGGYFELRALGEMVLKGVNDPVALCELVGVGGARSRLEVSIERGLSSFVGRAKEMQTLEAALEHAEQGYGQVVGIVGEPGLGKSRLCYEFVASCRRRGLQVYEAHCPAHGKNIPYLPILELFRNYFEIRADYRPAQARKQIAGTLLLLDPTLRESLPVLFEFLGVGDPAHPSPPMDHDARQRQLYELVHRIVRAQDAHGELSVTLIDDLHWVDEGSNGFVNQLVSAVAGRRSLILLNFRPEYEAAFASKAHYQQLPLVPLAEAALQELLADLIGDDDSLVELSERVIRWTAGNPFYIEELVHALVESGVLTGTRGRYRLVAPVSSLSVPTNVQAVLAARIDRLPEGAKSLLQTAAVIGKEFSGPLLETVQDLSGAEYDAAIERLKRGDFIFERSLYPIFEYAFKHPLTQEVAYRSQLHARRARVHAAVAKALESAFAEQVDERAALLAQHYEQAGATNAAAHWYRRAAEWAETRDQEAALRHWLRIRELVRTLGEDETSQAAQLLAQACSNAMRLVARVGAAQDEAEQLFAEGCGAAERCGDVAALVSLNINYGTHRATNEGGGADFITFGSAAVRIADNAGDAALCAGARAPLAWGYLYAGRLREVERIADEVIALVRDDIHTGHEVWGNSPLLAARNARAHAVGNGRDPVFALREFPRVRRDAIDAGYRENAIFSLALEMDLRNALGRIDDAQAMVQLALEWSRNMGAMWELIAWVITCEGAVCVCDWRALRATAQVALERISTTKVGASWEPQLQGFLGLAQLELGDAPGARAAAHAGVSRIRNSAAVWNPQVFSVLVRAQLACAEHASGITETLDEYAVVLERTGFHIYEGGLHELRAQLEAREGRGAQYQSALEHANRCYQRFGMYAQAARIAAASNKGDGPV